jgi:hypothetical protein
MSACRACKAPLLWARTEATGKGIPLDAESHPDGNVVFVREGARDVARVLGPLEVAALDPDVERFMPHHATCPNVGEFRR